MSFGMWHVVQKQVAVGCPLCDAPPPPLGRGVCWRSLPRGLVTGALSNVVVVVIVVFGGGVVVVVAVAG